MKKRPPDAVQIHELIRGLSENHILKKSPPSYVDDFVVAALEVYDSAKLHKVLQAKFFIPNESSYTDEAYYQSASELSVSHYIKQKEKQKLVTNFALERKVNAKNQKDVDDYFEIGATRVSVEIKCPLEEEQAPFPENITMHTAGRLPDHLKKYKQMKETIESGPSGTKFVLGKNRDLRMKDCLLSANEKFSSGSGVDDLNILFLSCGHFYKMSDWYMCLHGGQGLFTSQSFDPEARCPNVDFVILSNLKYRHQHARAYPAWTLGDVFILPIINQHHRYSCTRTAIEEGLSVFNHYRREFVSFRGSELVSDEHSDNRANIEKMLKVNHFVMEHLAPEERSRFFPVPYEPGKAV
jgi:hypothetical protein